MDSKTILFLGYGILGLILILFNKQIGNLNYKLVLYYTDKLNLKGVFLFKINHKNKDSLFFLTRSFAIIFGLAIIANSLYYLQG